MGFDRESLGELEKTVKTLACGLSSQSISRSLKLSLMFQNLDRNTVHVFYFINNTKMENSVLQHKMENSVELKLCKTSFFFSEILTTNELILQKYSLWQQRHMKLMEAA